MLALPVLHERPKMWAHERYNSDNWKPNRLGWLMKGLLSIGLRFYMCFWILLVHRTTDAKNRNGKWWNKCAIQFSVTAKSSVKGIRISLITILTWKCFQKHIVDDTNILSHQLSCASVYCVYDKSPTTTRLLLLQSNFWHTQTHNNGMEDYQRFSVVRCPLISASMKVLIVSATTIIALWRSIDPQNK